LHRFFDKHADKVGKELLSLSRPSEADAPAINGKKAWDNLCAALVDLDSSVPPPQPSQLDSYSLDGYLEFMDTHADSDTSSVAHLFVDSTPDVRSRIICRDSSCLHFLQRTKTSRCSSCSPQRSRQTLSTWSYSYTMSSRSVHFSLFAQHSSCRRVQQTMMDPRRVSQHYDIIIDLSGFAAGSQPPVQWLKFITEITPSDLRARKRSIYFLNINSLAHRFLRKIRNLSAGA
jgi:hypothetical protein